MKHLCILAAVMTMTCVMAALPAQASAYKTLYSMVGTGDGAGPLGGFIDVGGTLYGMTTYGGTTGNGSIVALNPATGTQTTVFEFTGTATGFFPPANLLDVGGLLYGVTQYGGAHGQGTIFTFNPATGTQTIVWSFGGAEGVVPQCTLIASGKTVYGTTMYGGANGLGTVFALVPSTGAVTPLYSFTAAGDAANPTTGLTAAGSMLYGSSVGGGAGGFGALYAVNTSTGAETVLYSFAGGTDAAYPEAAPSVAGSVLYGTTAGGGTNGLGAIYSFQTKTARESVPYSFSGAADGVDPWSALVAAKGVFYGTALGGGASGGGTLFGWSPGTGKLSVLHAFAIADGSDPYAAPLVLNNVVYGTTGYGGAAGQGTSYSVSLGTLAQTVLHDFTGSTPIESLAVTNLAGTLYALASNGGSAGLGAVATIAPANGSAAILHDFTAAGGFLPGGTLELAGKALYGQTAYGGTPGCGGLGCGTIFAIDPSSGAQTQVTAFPAGGYAAYSVADLLAVGGALYGTLDYGGANGFGSVFKVDPKTGTTRTIYSFAGGADGAYPFSQLLYIKGILYGTTVAGGSNGVGTIFKLDLAKASESVIYSFSGSAQNPGNGDAATPYSGLVYSRGVLYGTTFWGGAYGWGAVYAFDLAKVTNKVLHSFQPNGIDGTQPGGNLIDMNGMLYGMTVYGGSTGAGCDYNACGIVFSIDPKSGAETILHSFTGGADGGNPPYAALLTIGGVLYGTTGSAGANGLGTVFSLSP